MSKKVYRNTRWLIGGAIGFHGLFRITTISDYIDFVTAQFTGLIPSETVLIMASSLFPFVEFFVGILIVFNINSKGAIKVGMFLSLVMMVFMLQANLWERVLYHSVVIIGLILLYDEVRETQNNNTLI